MSLQTSTIQVICLESEAFYALIEAVVNRVNKGQEVPNKWIGDKEAMLLLGISSKTTLQKLRNEGEIRFSQPKRKIILYDRDSILQYFENNAINTF